MGTIRYIAFLRAINVGGHTVKMDDLRRHFAALSFTQVETFIASGNVIFESPEGDAAALERQIAGHLQQALGYAVATFLRTAAELRALTAYQPFPATALAGEGAGLYIGFLPDSPAAAATDRLQTLRTPADDFVIHGRELYWLRQGRLSDSPYTGATLEKTLRLPTTLRNVTTVQKLAAKYGSE